MTQNFDTASTGGAELGQQWTASYGYSMLSVGGHLGWLGGLTIHHDSHGRTGAQRGGDTSPSHSQIEAQLNKGIEQQLMASSTKEQD